ncbi:MAG: tryptophan 7-halogenase [Gammaproteobacteria bacterium]|nr:tryptophan 7-halogenase [Gammaproteobacteria bacterium]
MTDDRRIRHIAIVGGGTAGWLAAAVLARSLPGVGCRITVVESPEIAPVGVGEATIPPILDLLRLLGINQDDFVRHTRATYKLGIKFIDWLRIGSSYWHPFGTFGTAINLRPFHHAWQRAKREGRAPDFLDFSLCAALAEAGRFGVPDPAAPGPAAGLRHALHFDAGLVADYFSRYARALGVQHLERRVVDAKLREDGFIEALLFDEGSRLEADLYLDCSGFRGILIDKALGTRYLSWQQYLPCDRAIAAPTAAAPDRPPFTAAHAGAAGWRWRIPLQHRSGNGYVYSSAFADDEAAQADFHAAICAEPLAAPRLLRFVAGRRERFWNRNCVALGLASGFLEPLESTSIHLVMSGVYKLLEHFPDKSFAAVNIDSYNAELGAEMEAIRDFLILHYAGTQRDDTPFWRHCAGMALPPSLAARIELYRETGRVRTRAGELFTDLSWFYVLDGLGIEPRAHDPLIDVVPAGAFTEILAALARDTRAALASAPTHAAVLDAVWRNPGTSAAAAVRR